MNDAPNIDDDPRLCPLAWRPRLRWVKAIRAANVLWPACTRPALLSAERCPPCAVSCS